MHETWEGSWSPASGSFRQRRKLRMVSLSITACRVEWRGFSTPLHHSTQILLWIKSGSCSLGHTVSMLPLLWARGHLRQHNKKLPCKGAVNNTAKLLSAFLADCGDGVFSIASEGCLLTTSELRHRPPFGLKASLLPKNVVHDSVLMKKGKFRMCLDQWHNDLTHKTSNYQPALTSAWVRSCGKEVLICSGKPNCPPGHCKVIALMRLACVLKRFRQHDLYKRVGGNAAVWFGSDGGDRENWGG